MKPSLRWVVEEDTTLSALLDRLDAAAALGEGRVFIDGRRVRGDGELSLAIGSSVEVYPRRVVSDGVRLLERQAGIVVVYKPAGLPTEPDQRGDRSLRGETARLLKVSEQQLHAASRLDVGVSGCVLMALDRAARQRLTRWRGEGRIRRVYLGLAAGAPEPPAGHCTQPVGRPASTRYATVVQVESPLVVPGRAGDRPLAPALVLLEPVTGRRHQLRIHAAGLGAALLGDARYGGPRRLRRPDGSIVALERVALHAWRVLLPELSAEAPLPDALLQLWEQLGGGPDAWQRCRELAAVARG